jgi:hypothetical protein
MATEESGRRIRLVGGPLDGSSIEADASADEVVVTMADRTRHLYRAGSPPTGATDLPAFRYAGRSGPD